MTTPAFSEQDKRYMRRALQIAKRGFTSPNPMVGCVIVHDNAIVGEGYHPVAGLPHAEVYALRAAGDRARGAGAFVTLEPCSHWGRTPPCADALIEAGIARVVVAIADNNPAVSGRGIGRLREAGITVETGLLEPEARRLNEDFFCYHATGMPFITVKMAMSLDGKTSTRTGDSRWISGEASRREVHIRRARAGAVMVGIGSLLVDDAGLDARVPGKTLLRQPLRIVVDSRLRTPPDCAAVRLAGQDPEARPLLIATLHSAPANLEAALARPGIEVARFSADTGGHVDLKALISELGRRGIISVRAEGGPDLNAALLATGLVRKLEIFVAPVIIGGAGAPGAVGGEGIAQMADALRIGKPSVRRFGPDILLESYLTQPNP